MERLCRCYVRAFNFQAAGQGQRRVPGAAASWWQRHAAASPRRLHNWQASFDCSGVRTPSLVFMVALRPPPLP